MTDPSTYETRNYFPTPVIIAEIQGADEINAQLLPLIKQKHLTDAGVQRSNVLGWHSKGDMMEWGGGAMYELARQVTELYGPHSYDIVSPENPRFGFIPESWANVSPPGASNAAHSHPGCLWSGVYYVDDGYEDQEKDPGGELVLQDPRFPTTRMYAPDIVFRWRDGTREKNVEPIRPRTGIFIGFPSWLTHSVRPYEGTRERISVAINLRLAVAPGSDALN